MTVLVEPIGAGTIVSYFIGHPDKALRAMSEVDAPNLKMLFDAFHASNSDVDPSAFVQKNRDRIGHVHIANSPGRHEPGTGTIDYFAVFEALRNSDYTGAVGLEYIPKSETLSGLEWRRALGR